MARSKEVAMSLNDRMNSGTSINNGKDGSSQGVNRVTQKPKYRGHQSKGYRGKAGGSTSGHLKMFDGTECYRSGLKGHFSSDMSSPPRNKTCDKCGEEWSL